VAGVSLFVNARTDVYWLGIGDEAERIELALERALAYARAGADGIFVPGLADPGEIARFGEALDVHLNVLASARTPGLEELRRVGVARLSVGSGPMRAVLGLCRRMAQETCSPRAGPSRLRARLSPTTRPTGSSPDVSSPDAALRGRAGAAGRASLVP
jgi:2-methylisocitrate lyase-like PEP mutase family enzyme